MELQDLKKTWSRMSSAKELDEEQIRELLSRRTGNLIDRINRNVRIGFGVLFLLIVLFVLEDFVLAPMLVRDAEAVIEVPGWLVLLSIFSNAFIIITFIYFAVKYYFVKRTCDTGCNLRETLTKILGTLYIYKRLFYFALIMLSLAMALQFISGMYTGMAYDMKTQGIPFSEVPVDKLLLATGLGLVVLVLTVGGIFLLMRWGFRRLYGNYISELKKTLRELNELDN
jgi:hypothetical protein